MKKFSRLKINILPFMNVTEVPEYVAPLFKIQNPWSLQTFLCESKVECKTSFNYKGGLVFTTEIVNKFCISGEQ